MASVKLYKQDGSVSGAIELPDALFSVKLKSGVVHEAVVAQLANSRMRISQTKDRSEVSGGGKKPWKQKGTGRARHGSSRSPIWIGGGVTFGPVAARNFAKKVNKKLRRKALAMVLSDKVASEQFIVVDGLTLPEAKTSLLATARKSLPGNGAKMLIITTKEESALVQAAKNLPRTTTISATSLNVRDLLSNTYVLTTPSAVEVLKQTYLA